MAYLFSICLLVLVASCTKEYSLDIKVQPPNSGAVNASPSGGDYEEGTEVTITVSPSDGWEFSEFDGDISGETKTATITITENVVITAMFITSDESDGKSSGGSSGGGGGGGGGGCFIQTSLQGVFSR